jgi:hypothetical protein
MSYERRAVLWSYNIARDENAVFAAEDEDGK